MKSPKNSTDLVQRTTSALLEPIWQPHPWTSGSWPHVTSDPRSCWGPVGATGAPAHAPSPVALAVPTAAGFNMASHRWFLHDHIIWIHAACVFTSGGKSIYSLTPPANNFWCVWEWGWWGWRGQVIPSEPHSPVPTSAAACDQHPHVPGLGMPKKQCALVALFESLKARRHLAMICKAGIGETKGFLWSHLSHPLYYMPFYKAWWHVSERC